jgi:hypothetical protein
MKELHRIRREDILSLLDQSAPGGVLSLYVGIPATERHDPGRLHSAVRSGLNDLLRQHAENKHLASLVETVQTEIGKLPSETRRRSLVYFRSLEPDWTFWRSLHPILPDLFAYADSPQVSHLVSLLDEAPSLGVAVAAQDRARIFSWKEGVIEEHAEIHADEDSPAPPESPGHGIPPNRAEDRTRRGLHRMTSRIARIGDAHRWQKLLLVGPGPILGSIAEQLPDTWRRQLIPSVERNMINAPLAEINDLAGKRVYEWRRLEELAEITAIIDEERSGGRAATTVAACLDHLHKGRVEKLYVCSNLELSGYSDASGRLCLHPPSGAEESPIQTESRLVERMIVQAIESGAAVIPIEGESARKLALLGGVAARLRWKDAAASTD